MTNPFTLAEKAVVEEDGPGAPRYDGKNRYLIPDPDTGQTMSWTRATNFAKVLAETEALQRWGERMAVKGVVGNPQLLAQAQRTPLEASQALNRITRAGKDAAGAWTRAHQGTSLHTLTERVDRGELDPAEVVDPWGPLVRSYVKALRQAKVHILPEHIERTVIVRQFKVAGTFDRIVRMPNGELWIADLKTGRTLDYSWGEISIQLALYAHADAIYDFDKQTFLDMPEVNQTQGLIIYMPVEGTGVTLYRVNIAHGWEAAQLAEKVRHWRKFRGLSQELSTVTTDEDPDLPRKWVMRILEAKTSAEMGDIWREADRLGEWTDALTEYGKAHLARILEQTEPTV